MKVLIEKFELKAKAEIGAWRGGALLDCEQKMAKKYFLLNRKPCKDSSSRRGDVSHLDSTSKTNFLSLLGLWRYSFDDC